MSHHRPPVPHRPSKRVKFADLCNLATAAAQEEVLPAIILSRAPSHGIVVPPIMIPTTEPIESSAPKVPMAKAEKPAEDLAKKDIVLMQCTAWLEQMTHAPHSSVVREVRNKAEQILPLFYAEHTSQMTLLSALSNEQMRLLTVTDRSEREEAFLHIIISNIAYLSRMLKTSWKRVEGYRMISRILDQ